MPRRLVTTSSSPGPLGSLNVGQSFILGTADLTVGASPSEGGGAADLASSGGTPVAPGGGTVDAGSPGSPGTPSTDTSGGAGAGGASPTIDSSSLASGGSSPGA